MALLDSIDSDDPTALIGLPLIRTCALLREAGLDPLRRMTTAPVRGSLLLVPNTLDLGTVHAPPLDALLGTQVITEASRLTHWVAEDAKVARAFLKRVAQHAALALPLQSIQIDELPRPPKGRAAAADPRE